MWHSTTVIPSSLLGVKATVNSVKVYKIALTQRF